MTERERLNELLKSCGYIDEQFSERLADFLLENYEVFITKGTRQSQKKAAKDAIQNISEQDILMQIENFYQANKHFY